MTSTDKTPFYITTAITYPNGVPHIGHAYEYIATDAMARFKRLDGYDVFFLTGTDEHGMKIAQAAEKEGVTPKELVDRNAEIYKAAHAALGVSYDRFIRTTDADHYAASQAIWKKMEANGDIYLSKYEGWYSVRDEAFYVEDETVVKDDGIRYSRESDTEVTWTAEESYFFRLSAYQDKLLALYEAQPEFGAPQSRFNEVISFVKRGLEDLSISRTTFDWGVPVPGNDKHVMYVWVDALTNYLTGVGYPDVESESFKKFWPADVHVIGKDISRFHAIYWPAFLMSAGLELPKRIMIHGFLQNNGVKMSKSLGNVVAPARLRRPVRPGPGALLLPARGPLRRGRQLQPRGNRGPDELGPGQQLRQPGPAVAVHGGQELRGPGARARRASPPRTPPCSARPTACWTLSAPRSRSRSSAARWRPSGPSWATPTPTSPSRPRGCCARPTSSA